MFIALSLVSCLLFASITFIDVMKSSIFCKACSFTLQVICFHFAPYFLTVVYPGEQELERYRKEVK